MRFHGFRRSIVPALFVFALGACNDEPDFGFGDWDAQLDTVTLYSVDRDEYQGLPSAYDIRFTRTYRVEDPGSTGNWDFALTGGDGGPLSLTPIGAFFDVENDAGLVLSDDTFEEIENAPSASDAYTTDEPVVIEEDVVYIVRSRSGSCLQFAKLEPIEIDQDAGTFTFHVTANPNCNDTALVPPED
mgnify:CR=1 FL=1